MIDWSKAINPGKKLEHRNTRRLATTIELAVCVSRTMLERRAYKTLRESDGSNISPFGQIGPVCVGNHHFLY